MPKHGRVTGEVMAALDALEEEDEHTEYVCDELDDREIAELLRMSVDEFEGLSD